MDKRINFDRLFGMDKNSFFDPFPSPEVSFSAVAERLGVVRSSVCELLWQMKYTNSEANNYLEKAGFNIPAEEVFEAWRDINQTW